MFASQQFTFFRYISVNLFVCLLLFMLFFTPANVFPQKLNIRNYSAEDGLAQSQIQVILQDDEGYLWFGTVNGLYKFDGQSFVNFNKNNGLSQNYIESGFKDRQGNLWFGHHNGSLTRFNWQTREFQIIYLFEDDPGAKLIYVEEIFQDKNDVIWVGTLGWGVFRFEGERISRFTVKDGLRNGQVFDICYGPDSALWFGTMNGIFVYNPHANTFDSLALKFSPPNNSVMSLFHDHLGRIWIGTANNGLFCYQSPNRFIGYTMSDGLASLAVTNIIEDDCGQIWASTLGGGVSKYISGLNADAKGSFQTITRKNGLAHDLTRCVFQDREGNIWVGTDGGGASQIRKNNIEVYDQSFGLADDCVWNILVDRKGAVWFGTDNGICRYQPNVSDNDKIRVKNFTHFAGEELKYIAKCFEDSRGNLWFLSYQHGLFRWKGGIDNFEKIILPDVYISRSSSDINEDSSGKLWISSSRNGLLSYDPQTHVFTHLTSKTHGLSSDSINVIFKDSKANLWFGTNNGGLMKYNGHEFIIYSSRTSFPITSGFSITEDPRGNIWFISQDDELYKFDGRVFINYSSELKLPLGAMYSVIAGKSSLWIGTSNGIAQLNYGDSSLIHLGEVEGYPIAEANENAVFKDRDGFIWFGTINGAIKMDADGQQKNQVAPLLNITRLRIFLKDAPLPPEGKFSYDRNYLTFHFIGLSYTVPERILYKYKLAGFDDHWSPATKENYATYSNLAPGKYRFEVIAANNDGAWSEKPAVYAFEILAPFWQTWWFYLLVVVVVIFSISFYIQVRIRKVERDKKILESKVEKRTAELREQKENVEKANQALRESEAKFRAYTELASSAIFIYRGDKFVYLNAATEVITGYTRQELLQKNFWDVVHPDYMELVRERGKARQKGEQVPMRYQYKIVTKTGDDRWLDFTARGIEDDGQPAALGTAFDITAQKKSEEALIIEKERLAVTLRSIGDGVITTDVDWKIVIFNKMAEVITGWVQDDVQGRLLSDIFKIFDEKDGSQLPDPVNEITQSGDCSLGERTSILISRDGRRRNIIYSVAPLRDKESKLFGVALIFHDITEQRKMEEELLKTQKLESVGILAGGIAHDFNNILTAILGNLSLIRMYSTPGEKIYQRAESAEKATIRAQDLTQQLLTFAKGGAPIKETTAIDELIRDSVSFMLRGSKVRWRIEVDKALSPVDVDAGQMSQVIQNLVINASQAMPTGGDLFIRLSNVSVDAAMGLPLKDRCYVKIDLEDTGIGIPHEYLTKIFDPFFTTKQAGSGLGLATSYSIIKKHQGHINVNSVIGKGTIFTIYIPASTDGVDQKKHDHKAPLEHRATGRILIMDDEEIVRATAADILLFFGYEVECAFDGAEALEKYRQGLNDKNKFDLVIMDLTIPGGMGGQIAIKKLLDLDPEAKAIVSSGYSSDPVMSDYAAYGFKGCLRKPFKIDEFGWLLKHLEIGQINL